MLVSRSRAPEATRQKILESAFAEFYRHGFQGGSLNRIVEAAQVTKGALFHHFRDKEAVGYAVVDEVIGPLLEQRWLAPLAETDRPVVALKRAFRRYIQEDAESGHFALGCPLNNLAQEMSPLDEGFHERIDALYRRWRQAVGAALERGIEAGTVRDDVAASQVAALVVAAQMGIWGSAKSSRNAALMAQAGESLCHYLESLETSFPKETV
jgi:AcrR family transcriptional regulator